MGKQRWILGLIVTICSETTVKLRCRALVVGLLALLMCSSMCIAATCPSSTSSLTAISTEQFRFEWDDIQTYGVVAGPVTNSLYYLNYVYQQGWWWYYGNEFTILLKVDAFGSQSWLFAYYQYPRMKSLSVDTTEQYVYYVRYNDYAKVMKIKTDNGTFESQHE